MAEIGNQLMQVQQWIPKTDNESSLAMGSIVIDPVNPEIIYAGTGEATYSVCDLIMEGDY